MNMSAMFTWAKCLHFGSSEPVIIAIKRKLASRILSLIPFWAMSGFTPIQFTKAATKEGGRLPTNEEKDADALQRVAAAFGSAPETKVDSANPGPQPMASEAGGSALMKPESMAADLAASFEPSAAGGAINAVIVPPTSATGLEDGVEHMEVEKEKSEDDWMIADPAPLTETEMVGSFLQDQEKKDREQYVFLTQEDADMETLHDHLAALTEHIHRLSVGELTETVAGPQTDGPKRVEVEPAGDGFFRLTCFPEPFPHVSRYVSSLLGGLSVQEVAQLFDIFRGKPLTRAGCGEGAGVLHYREAHQRAWQAPGQEVLEALGQKGHRLWRDEGGGCRCSNGDDVSHLPDTHRSREEEVSFLQVDGGSGALHSAHGEHDGGWQTLHGNFALRPTAPTTGRPRGWLRKRRMQPW